MVFTVQERIAYSLLKDTSGIEIIKPPGRNLNTSTVQKLSIGCVSL
jgi:hypothetical protein